MLQLSNYQVIKILLNNFAQLQIWLFDENKKLAKLNVPPLVTPVIRFLLNDFLSLTFSKISYKFQYIIIYNI